MINVTVAGKKVLVRVDFNVPIDKDQMITDDTRIRKAVPTIEYLLNKNATVILISHLGRPLKKLLDDGSINRKKFSLKPVANHLSEIFETTVTFVSDCIGEEAIKACRDAVPGSIILLENTRFYKEETAGDIDFAGKLAHYADVFINDAFGTAHRAHASTAIIGQFFDKKQKGLGLLMQDEIANAQKVLNSPSRPCIAIFGGAKVSDKIKLIEKFINFADTIIIGGGMSYTFIKAMNGSIGNSLCEDHQTDLAKDLLDRADQYGVKILIPEDSVIANDFSNEAEIKTCLSNEIPDGWMGLDIGPNAIQTYKSALSSASTIIWNGPMGVFEMSNFSKGTMSIAHEIANLSSKGAYTLVGGGDSVAAINKSGRSEDISFISTGGGALLAFLEGKKLPGILAIES